MKIAILSLTRLSRFKKGEISRFISRRRYGVGVSVFFYKKDARVKRGKRDLGHFIINGVSTISIRFMEYHVNPMGMEVAVDGIEQSEDGINELVKSCGYKPHGFRLKFVSKDKRLYNGYIYGYGHKDIH